ncbi:SusF/SusE family outer membrane protein [Gelidibacter mesophilus]|uniref:SusF/SusE family outer membrane protein n=1 Tax=Gelidibacter mesophilus TaxID=169050 RepID=UPI0003FA7421|nr:SusF/SusE family outer membrane protein [Gelidibacter mesophilus]
MKNFKILTLFILAMVGLNSCETDDDIVFIAQESGEFVITNTLLPEYILKSSTGSNLGERFTWSNADFGVPTNVSYDLQRSIAGDFSDAVLVGTTTGNEIAMIIGQMMTIATEAGLDANPSTPEPNTGAFSVRIRAYAGNSGSATEVFSDVKTISVVLQEATSGGSEITKSTWGIVGSAAPNGWDGPDAPFYTTSESNVIAAYVTLIDGQIKFRENNSWGGDFGDIDMDGVLDQEGDNNIDVTAGTYKITIDWNDNTYTLEKFYWGIVGSATPNGWDGPDTKLQYDFNTDSFKTVVQLTDGELKFRMNDTWGGDYGDLDLDGILDQENENNIKVTAGYYLITANFNTLEYSIEPTEIWGAVGSSTPNGWDGPDSKFTPDFSNPGIWTLKNFTLKDGQIKFRTNDAWGNDYGDLELDGVLDKENENNINVTARTYTTTLDFSDSEKPTYSIK